MKGRWCWLILVLAGCGVAPPPPPSPPPQKVETPPPKAPPAKSAAAPAPKAPPPPAAPAKAPPAPTVAAPAAPGLDLKALEERLRATPAIGALTKLSLKNQVDDLISRFRQYHAGHRPPGLSDLRPAFELLLMKVLALLQDSDRALARDINASRESLWAVLADRDKLAQYQ